VAVSEQAIFLDYFDLQVGFGHDAFDDFQLKLRKLKFELLCWPKRSLVIAAPALAKSVSSRLTFNAAISSLTSPRVKLSLAPKYNNSLLAYTKQRLSTLENSSDEKTLSQLTEYRSYNSLGWQSFQKNISDKSLFVDREGNADELFRVAVQKNIEDDSFQEKMRDESLRQEVQDRLTNLLQDRNYTFHREGILRDLTDLKLSETAKLVIEQSLNLSFNSSGASAINAMNATQFGSFDAMTIQVLARKLPYNGYDSLYDKFDNTDISVLHELSETHAWQSFNILVRESFDEYYSSMLKQIRHKNSTFSRARRAAFSPRKFELYLKSAAIGSVISFIFGFTPVSLLSASILSGAIPPFFQRFLVSRNRLQAIQLYKLVCETLKLIESND